MIEDASLGESAAVLELSGADPIRVEAALGSPQCPMTPTQLQSKVVALAGKRLEGSVEGDRPARRVLEELTVPN